jgi:phytoene synthase
MLDVSWDNHLVKRATIKCSIDDHVELPDHQLQEVLNAAYNYCRNVTAINSKSFYLASGLLPNKKSKAIRALYAFCRTTDDIIDLNGKQGETELHLWRNHGLSPNPRANDPVAIAWADTRQKFNIPSVYAQQLLDGVCMDIYKDRYKNFNELAEYCYGAASTVGLMSMYIIGFKTKSAIRYAVKLGVALQLTNILRDISEDYKLGRVYLPQDELYQFGITEKYISEGINDDKWKSFMKFQIDRTRSIYQEAWPGIPLLHPSGQLSIAAAATFYKGILDKIEENDFDVFSSRACIGKWRKLKTLPELWFKHRFLPQWNHQIGNKK